jgi:ElaB/YqjD/DUF883 family membrane-anchored ribosome-binding protein
MKSNGTGTAVADRAEKGISGAVRAGEDTLEVLREDLTAIRDDVSKLMKHGREELVNRAGGVAKSATQSAKAVADQARERAVEARDAVTTFATERPFATIALAVAGGVLLAAMCPKLWRR